MGRRIGQRGWRGAVGPGVALAAVMSFGLYAEARDQRGDAAPDASVQIRFLEIVTPDLDKTCETLAAVHGVIFGEPTPELGNARTASLKGGGVISVRAPMRATEAPVVRPYLLVDDIGAAVKEAEARGAVIVHPALEIPGHGTFAIYILGGIEHGLWQD